MSIEYVSIYDGQQEVTSLSMIGIVDTAKSIIWHSTYFGVGDFEVFAPATKQNLALLQVNNFVTRPNNREVGIIEKIEITHEPHHGMMITASGRFAKSILKRRLCLSVPGGISAASEHDYVHAVLSDYLAVPVEWKYVAKKAQTIVLANAIDCTMYDPNNTYTEENELLREREIPILELGGGGDIEAQRVFSFSTSFSGIYPSENDVFTVTETWFKIYGLAATVLLDEETGKLKYEIYEGTNRSVSSGIDRPIVFSKDFDNLTSCNYLRDISVTKNVAYIKHNRSDRYLDITGEEYVSEYEACYLYGRAKGLSRYEFIVDATNADTVEVAHDKILPENHDELFAAYIGEAHESLSSRGSEVFDGKINLVSSQWELGKDFFLGDIVTIQDNDIDKYVDVRVTEILETQDDNGYSIEAVTEIYEGGNQYDQL